jgi:mono/diheme cytochrome c family protein
MTRFIFLISSLLACSAAQAAPQDLLQGYATQAKQENPQYQAFSATRGEQFYHAKRMHSSGKAQSCAACHTDNPRSAGRNEKTGKEILPLAPGANKDRLTDATKVEKWFKRNCQDVLERACTAQEKGDFLTYLLSIK